METTEKNRKREGSANGHRFRFDGFEIDPNRLLQRDGANIPIPANPRIASQPVNDLGRHHSTYNIGCIYALAGKSGEAVKWLNETASTGFPNYPLFEHDFYLDRIRHTPAFIQFMAAEKEHWEHLRQEFGD